MKTKGKMLLGGLAAGGLLGGRAASLPYVRGGVKGSAYALGLKSVPLDGVGRLVATILRRADRPPCFAQMHQHVQHVSGVPPEKFYRTDAGLMARAFRQVSDWYGMDLPLAFTDSYNYEAEALGAEMVYGTEMPTINYSNPLIREPGDLDRVNLELTIDSGRLRYLADNVRAIEEYCGLPPAAILCAPLSLAVGLRSYPRLIHDMRRDPAFAHELFTWITDEVHPRIIRILKEETGLRLCVAADAWSCVPNLTPDMIENWVVPYNTRMRRNLLKQGVLLSVLASGDYCEENPERFDRDTMEFCWRAFARAMLGNWMKKGFPIMGMGLTQQWPLEWMREYATRDPVRFYGNRFVVAGYNAKFLQEGPVEAIVDFTKRVIDVLGREGRLLFFFTQITATTPPEHVHAAVAAIKTYGRYPIARDLDDVRFEMPRFEPFDEWRKKNW